MATAEMYKGRAIVAYVNGEAVDSNGEVIEGAPKPPKDTDPSQQPHAMAALNTEERSAAVLASGTATGTLEGRCGEGSGHERSDERRRRCVADHQGSGGPRGEDHHGEGSEGDGKARRSCERRADLRRSYRRDRSQVAPGRPRSRRSVTLLGRHDAL